jgi:4-hydroxybenzoate polyprenyltransferase/phosphoserine phosphatase
MTNPTKPLVVDLDGTLIRNDLLHDSLLHVLIRQPQKIIRVISSLFLGKLALKETLAKLYVPNIKHVVVNPEVLDLIENARSNGARVILASASHQILVTSVSNSLGIFDEAIGSETENLSGEFKEQILVSKYGLRGFDYVGNSKADLEIWRSANRAHVVSSSKKLYRQAKYLNSNTTLIGAQNIGKHILLEMRVHQWLKNLLVFVPLLTSFQMFDLGLVAKSFTAFLSFSFMASGIYFINDLADVNSDREHSVKRNRPIAAGFISVPSAVIISVLLISAGLGLAFSVSFGFASIAIFYLVITSAYSFALKQIAVLDCVILASLYTLRVVAGGVATEISLTYWLLAFSSFIFFSLAWMKRFAEVRNSSTSKQIPGRGYSSSDKDFLFVVGSASAFVSILIFALYLENIQSSGGYNQPELSWAALPVLTYWLCRIWLLAFRGKMNEDPILFAAKDKTSVLCAILLVFSLAAAHTGITFVF